MGDDELVLDLETQNDFSAIGGRGGDYGKLGVSVVGVYSYQLGTFLSFGQSHMPDLEALFRKARRIVGYNIRHFDIPVLAPHISFPIGRIPLLDLMDDPARILGFRPKLNDLVKATLGMSKSGHGMDAIRWYREGRMEELTRYCLDDVRLTKDLFEFGAKNGHVLIEQGIQQVKVTVPVTWQALPKQSQMQPSLFTPDT